MTSHNGDHGVHCWSCNQAMRSRLTGMAQMAAKLARRDDLSDEEAVKILIAVYEDMTTFMVQCPDCARGIAKAYEEYWLRRYDNLMSQWHDFWCQVAIVALFQIALRFAVRTYPSFEQELKAGRIFLPPETKCV